MAVSKIPIRLEKLSINLYAGARLAAAVKDMTKDMTLYDGVKYVQILEAVYKQGRKDGAAGAFTAIQKGMRAAEKAIPHRNPGRPRKKK